ncbi:MAG: hypothetical protein NTY09_10000 [bacterium]|nr:hypothetical protein [bacterium]
MVLTSSCATPPPESKEAAPPWTDVPMTNIAQPMDLRYEPITVIESSRYTPPDGKVWPAAVGYTGQTMWGVDGSKISLYACANSNHVTGENEDEDYVIVPTSIYQWDLTENIIGEYPLDPSPPDKSWMPIPLAVRNLTQAGVLERYSFAVVSAGSASSTRGVTIEDSGPMDLPIIDSVSYYGVDGKLMFKNEIERTRFELSSTNIFVPCDRLGAPVLVAENYLDYFLRMPDGVTRIATNWAKLDLIGNEIVPFGDEIDMTLGAELTGFSNNPGIYFFAGVSPYDGKEYTFYKGTCCVKAFQAVDLTDDATDNPLSLRITGYIPSVRFGESVIVFAEYGEDVEGSETTHIAAVRFNKADPLADDPYIVWHADVPKIFGVCTVLYAGEPSRPYILTLDPTNGDIKVFDPLLGSIRYEGNIEIAQWHDGMNLAEFAVTLFPSPFYPVAYIHDPNANEIIELRLGASENGLGGGIEEVN